MSYCVMRLAKRVSGTRLEVFHAHALQRAREAAPPKGCTGRAHSRTVARAYRHGEPAYDTLDEHHFEDLTAARAWRASMGAQRPDEQVTALLTRPQAISPGPAPGDGLKHLELVCRRADLGRPAFLAYWRGVHGPLATGIPGMLRYQQCPAVDDEYAECQPLLDGIAVLWFASIETMREGARHPAFAHTREDMAHFMDTARSVSLLTQEVWSSTS